MDRDNRTKRGRQGWFYKSQPEWTEELCLSRCEQETARRILKKFSFWQEARRGVPARLWYRVDFEQLARAIEEFAGNQHSGLQASRMRKTGEPARQKPAVITSSEITSQNTSRTECDGAKHIEGDLENAVQLPSSNKEIAKKPTSSFPSWAKDELSKSLYRGIHNQAIANAFFDSRNLSAEEQLAECVRVGTTTLVTARVATLMVLDANEIEESAFRALCGGLKILSLVRDPEARKTQTVRSVVRVIVETCCRMLREKAA